jgi:hypothetical protein
MIIMSSILRQRLRRVSLFLISLIFYVDAYAQDAANDVLAWEADDYLHTYGDFNADGIADIFLLGRAEGITPIYVLGEYDGTESRFRQVGIRRLNRLVDYTTATTKVAAGDFNADGFDDLLVVHQPSQTLRLVTGSEAGLLLDSVERIDVGEGAQQILSRIDVLGSGNVNGDEFADVFLLVDDYQRLMVLHNQSSEGVLRFSRASTVDLGRRQLSSFRIADYNGDGLEDVALFSAKAQSEHYILFADEQGMFSRAQVQVVSSQLGGADWHTDENAVVTWQGDGNRSTILRLKNQVGGIDEFGQVLDANGEVSELTLEQLNQNTACEVLEYSPDTNQAQQICTPWEQDSNTANVSEAVLKSEAQSTSKNGPASNADIELCNTPLQSNNCVEPAPPPRPSTPRVNGGGSHPINGSYTITVDSISSADSYEFFESRSDSNYQLIGSGTSISRTRSHSTFGHRYYRVRACNLFGCGPMSSFRRIFVYSAPGGVNNLSSSVSTIEPGQSVSLSWSTPGGIIATGFYRIQEIRPNGSTVTLGETSSRSYTVRPNSGSGSYQYRVRACNPNNLCGSYRTRTVTVNAPNVRPSVSATGPSSGASLLTTQSVTATANASDSDGSVSRVEFRLDGGSWQSDSSSPYSRGFGTLSPGSHTIQYRARDNDGEYSFTASRSFSVVLPNVAPSLSSLTPANNASFESDDSVTATANASDSDGSVSRVEFRLDGGSWQSDTTSPYSRGFGTLSSGSHTIQYRARDNDGDYSSITTRSISVAQSNRAPLANNDIAAVNQGNTVAIDVLANDTDADNDGLVITSVTTSTTRGSAQVVNGGVEYTANAQALVGTDTLTYSIADGNGGTAQGIITIAVNATYANFADETVLIGQPVLFDWSVPNGVSCQLEGESVVAQSERTYRFYELGLTTLLVNCSNGQASASIVVIELPAPSVLEANVVEEGL